MTDEQITALNDHKKGCEGRTYTCTCGYDDAQAAENARLRERLTQAIERLRDMLQGDDGQAWDEARRFVDIIAQETQL
jgi:hypothetical protein